MTPKQTAAYKKEIEENWLNDHITTMRAIINSFNKANQFKVGDYLVLYDHDELHDNYKVYKDTSKSVIKFQVVYKDEESGIPFARIIRKDGKPSGNLLNVLYDPMLTIPPNNFEEVYHFELDPDYADSILLGTLYEPYPDYAEKKERRDEIVRWNKHVKFDTKDPHAVVEFLKRVRISDKYWTSNKKFITILGCRQLRSDDVTRSWYRRVKKTTLGVLQVVDSNGKKYEIHPYELAGKNLYREQPRSYKEINI